jgi:hypothetical protein
LGIRREYLTACGIWKHGVKEWCLCPLKIGGIPADQGVTCEPAVLYTPNGVKKDAFWGVYFTLDLLPLSLSDATYKILEKKCLPGNPA